MESAYITVAVFIVLALVEPAAILLTSILIRRRPSLNPVKLNNYESAERSLGKRLSIMNEYLPYFPMFLSYEIILAVMLIWVLSARQLTTDFNILLIGLFAFGFIMQFSVLKVAAAEDE